MSENFFYPAAIALALGTVVGLVLAILRRRRRLREDAERRALAAQAAVLEAQREAAAQAAERAAAQEAARRHQEREAQAAAEREAARQRALAEQAAREKAAEEAAQRAAEAAAAMAAARAAAERRAAELAEEARRRAEAEARRLAPPPPPPAPPAPPAAPRRPEDTLVMVADDSKVVRVKTSRLLAQHGYRVVLAEDGAQAAQLIEQEVPLVLITDVEMPGMDGFALTRHVRSHPKAHDIAIIMITSADDRLKEAAEEAGVTLVLGKPYPEEALLDCIQRVQGQPA